MSEIILKPIGWVRTDRKNPEDDFWGGTISFIELDSNQFDTDCLSGLESFSHLEIIYYFHQIEDAKIQSRARHPRNNTLWPKVGIFSQRAKGRPNRLGLSRCVLLEVSGLILKVQNLDALDQSPVLDIKPYMKEFGPQGEVKQPSWATELMQNYYRSEK
mgnify:CR=1 FL=1